MFCSLKRMRSFASLLIVAVVVTATASVRPLSNKEIALMLRSGYSSESILREIAARRVLDPLDATTKKSLLEFGANAQLISALEGGTFVVLPTEAEHAKQQEADLAARQAAQIESDQKLNTLYQGETQARAKTAAKQTPAPVPIIEALKDKLVHCHDDTITSADRSEVENKKLVALYFSAHWCAPCRKFTPELVDFYNRVAPEHPEFQIIFISLDRSRFGWETYLRESKMPWLAIDYDQLGAVDCLRKLGGDNIPSLLVLDASAQIVASSYDGEQYLGPHNALAALERIFAQKAARPIAHL